MSTTTQIVQSLVSQVGYGAGHVTRVAPVQSLWAGYGSIYAVETAGSNDDRLIVKHFTPPAHRRIGDDSEDHRRKLRSYSVERVFYERLSRKLIDAGLEAVLFRIPGSKHMYNTRTCSFACLLFGAEIAISLL